MSEAKDVLAAQRLLKEALAALEPFASDASRARSWAEGSSTPDPCLSFCQALSNWNRAERVHLRIARFLKKGST